MKRFPVLVVVMMLMACLPACAAPTLSAADKKFMMEAAQGGLAEVEIGHYVQMHGTSSQVKDFGKMLAMDHSAANSRLAKIAAGYKITLPKNTDKEHQAAMKKLFALSGSAFDKAFADMAVKDHQKDIAAFQKEASTTQNADLKKFCQDTLPTLQKHLQAAQAAQKGVAAGKGSPSGQPATK